MKLGPRAAFWLFAFALVGTLYAIKLFGSGYHETVAALTLVNIILAVSLTMTNGFTGLLSLGHPAFMTLGAYVAVILTYPQRRKSFMLPELPEFLANTEWGLTWALIAAALAAGLLAWLVGYAVLRLKTHYLAVATLGLIIIVQGLANNLDGITRGGRGITGIPRLADMWLAAGIAVLAILTAWRIKHASLGRAMLAVRENELAASCFGISGFRLKLMVFVIGAVFAGLAGALIPHIVAVLSPKSFGVILAFNLVAMVVVGGQGSIIGAVVAALAISGLTEFAKPLEESLELYGLVQILIALALIIVLLWRPKGLFGLNEPLIDTDRRS